MIVNDTNLTIRQLEELCWILVESQKANSKILYNVYMSAPVPKYTKTVSDSVIEYVEDNQINTQYEELLKLQTLGHYEYCLGNYLYLEDNKDEVSSN